MSITLREQERRLLARWAADCAERTLPLFEANAPDDSRPRDALDALRAYALGAKRTAALRTHVSAALAAAREVEDDAATAAARAAAVATGIAWTHTEVTPAQVKHVLAPVAYAALARELAADAKAAEHEIAWAVDHATASLRALVRRMPVYRAKAGRLEALMGTIGARLRGRPPRKKPATERRMTLAAVEKRCAAKPDVQRTTPFGPRPHVYKTNGKMFALCGHLDGQEVVSLKCDPERSSMLRSSFAAITGGYHLNKDHWNTIALDGSVPASLIRELVDHAYDVIRASTSRSSRRASRGTRRGA